MDAADFHAHVRQVAATRGRRWLGPHAKRCTWQSRRRRRATAQKLLRAWVSEHAADQVPAFATWMLAANVPGAEGALPLFRHAIELPLARDSWRTSQSRLIAASIAHQAAVDGDARRIFSAEDWQSVDLQRQQLIKAQFQASEEEDWLSMELEEICTEKMMEDFQDRLLVMGATAALEYSALDDVPLSIRHGSRGMGGSHGCGGAGSSWGPHLRRRRRFAFRRFHANVAPYAPAHEGASSMHFAPDLTSSAVAARLASRCNPAGRVDI